MAKKNQILIANNIQFQVPEKARKILNVSSLKIDTGLFTFILGDNGAGKSTLLSIIGGQIAPTSGQILWKSRPFQPLAERLVSGFEGIELVQQNPDSDPYWNVDESLDKALRWLPNSSKEKKKKELIRLCGLRPLLQTQNENLSGGEKRRLAIALALAKEVELLLLDEPFADLDYSNKAILMEILLGLKSEKRISVVLVSHHGEDAQWLADRILVLHSGKIIEKLDRSVNGFIPQKLKTARLLGYKNLIPASEFSVDSKTTDWIYIPETAVCPEMQKGRFAWKEFRLVRQYYESGHWKQFWYRDGTHLYICIPTKCELESALMYVDLSSCLLLN